MRAVDAAVWFSGRRDIQCHSIFQQAKSESIVHPKMVDKRF